MYNTLRQQTNLSKSNAEWSETDHVEGMLIMNSKIQEFWCNVNLEGIFFNLNLSKKDFISSNYDESNLFWH